MKKSKIVLGIALFTFCFYSPLLLAEHPKKSQQKGKKESKQKIPNSNITYTYLIDHGILIFSEIYPGICLTRLSKDKNKRLIYTGKKVEKNDLLTAVFLPPDIDPDLVTYRNILSDEFDFYALVTDEGCIKKIIFKTINFLDLVELDFSGSPDRTDRFLSLLFRHFQSVHIGNM